MCKLNYLRLEATEQTKIDASMDYDMRLGDFMRDIRESYNFVNFRKFYFGANLLKNENSEYLYFFAFWPDYQFQKFINLNKALKFECIYYDVTKHLLDRSIFENQDFIQIYKYSSAFKKSVDEFIFLHVSVDEILDKIYVKGKQALYPIELQILRS